MSKTRRRLISKQHNQAFDDLVQRIKKAKNIQEIQPAELYKLLESKQPLLVIDVREESERSQFYLDGSIHISKGVIERDIESFVLPENQNMPIVTICSGGYRSTLAAASLLDMGYTKIYSLAGGLKDYLEKDFSNIVEMDLRYLVDE